MAQVINSNIASLNAQRQLNHSQSALNTSLERLSSGLKINSAKDDSAGLAISERMTAQIRGLNQAARNANDGISLAQTAEGALSEIGNNLQRIRELAVQSANATNTSSDRASIQSEVDQLTAEITRVAGQTQFNGLNLLDGSFANQNFQVGANAGQTISVSSIGDSRATALGSNTLTSSGGDVNVVDTVASGPVTNGIAVATTLAITTDKGTTSQFGYAANASAADIAAAINTNAGSVGVEATASNTATLSGLSAAGTITFNLNGSSLSVAVSDNNNLSDVVSAINGVQGATGVTATFTSDSAKNSITLTTTDGRNIRFEDFTSSAGATDSISFDGTTLTEGTAVSAVKTGTVSLSSSAGAISLAGADAAVFSSTSSSFASLAAVDVSSASASTSALATVDAALQQVNSSRGDLGALQNRFQSTISNLQTNAENLSASRSRIQDADFAAETAALTRGQILQQAGVAMLAQANALPNNVLSLLR